MKRPSSEDFQNVVRRLCECFRTFSELFWKLSKIAKEDPKMFRFKNHNSKEWREMKRVTCQYVIGDINIKHK